LISKFWILNFKIFPARKRICPRAKIRFANGLLQFQYGRCYYKIFYILYILDGLTSEQNQNIEGLDRVDAIKASGKENELIKWWEITKGLSHFRQKNHHRRPRGSLRGTLVLPFYGLPRRLTQGQLVGETPFSRSWCPLSPANIAPPEITHSAENQPLGLRGCRSKCSEVYLALFNT